MRTPAAALAATLALCPLLAAAQAAPTADAAPPVLTLAEALRDAEAHNHDLQAARARLEQARAGVARAWSAQLPQLTAAAAYTRNSEGAALELPTGAGTQRLVLQEEDQLTAAAAVTQALLAPAAWPAIRASRQGVDAAARAAEAARRELRFGVEQAYLGAVSLRHLVQVSEELLAIARRQERDAGQRHRAGELPRAGAVRAAIDRARAEQDLVRARHAYEGARIALARLLDRAPDFEVAPAPEPPLPADLGHLVTTALRERPDLAAARRGEEAAASLRQAAAQRRWPTLGAFGRWQVSNLRSLGGREDSWAVGVGLSWTMYDGGLREAELRDAGGRAAEAAARRAAAEAQATAEVRQALADLAAARASARQAREQADLAAENQRLVEASWRAGAATAVEQADAASARRAAEVAAVTEELQAQVAVRRVLYAAGLEGEAG